MKHNSAFSRIFVKSIVVLFLSSVVLPAPAVAAIDASLSLQSKTTTSAVIVFKNNIQATVDGNGQYRDTMEAVARVIRAADGVQATTLTLRSIGKEQKEVTFSGLQAGTAYIAEFSVENLTTREKKMISLSFTTTGTAATTGTPVLPVSFLTGNTVTSTNKIDLLVRNSSTREFKVVVTATQVSNGAVVETRETTVPREGNASLHFVSGIAAGETYNFTMTGTQVGVSTAYRPVTYTGVKALAQTVASGGTQTGGTGSGGVSQSTPTGTGQQGTATGTSVGDGTCGNGKDDDGDGRYDWDGVPDASGQPQFPPDPSCINKDQTEKADDVASGSLIPCTNKCDLGSFFEMLNGLISFFIKVILFPISILLFVYAGYKYITAQGNPAKKANVKKMIGNLILGIVIILTAWLAVKTALVLVGYDQSLYFFE